MKKFVCNKGGFGIVEVLVAAAVLGFMYMAILNMQNGNHDALLRIRGRDGAGEVAQQVLDSLKRVGIASIPSKADGDTTVTWPAIQRSWDRGLGGKVKVDYTPQIKVSRTSDYVAESGSNYESVSHVYAKQVNVTVSWQFKGSTQSVNVSGVIR